MHSCEKSSGDSDSFRVLCAKNLLVPQRSQWWNSVATVSPLRGQRSQPERKKMLAAPVEMTLKNRLARYTRGGEPALITREQEKAGRFGRDDTLKTRLLGVPRANRRS